jgi:hypothetical protein
MAALMSMEELASMPAGEPSHWVVEGLFKTQTKRPSCILGYAEAGKSTLAAQLAIAVSQGKPFLGSKTEKSKVLYWKFEETELDTLSDFKHAGAHTNGDINFIFPKLGDDNFKALEDALLIVPETRLVLVETFMDFFCLGDVSSNDEERDALQRFHERISSKYPDCVFVILHHYNKTNLAMDVSKLSIAKILGGTAFAAGTATKLYMQQVSDADPRRVLTATTRGRGRFIEPTYLEFDQSTSTSVLGMTVKGEALAKKKETKSKKKKSVDEGIFEVLTDNPTGIAKWTLVDKLPDKRATRQRIEELVATGIIEEKVDPKDPSHAKKLFMPEIQVESLTEAVCK